MVRGAFGAFGALKDIVADVFSAVYTIMTVKVSAMAMYGT